MTGPIPTELGSLTSLRVLDLGESAIRSSELDTIIPLAPLSYHLSLYGFVAFNALRGPIPTELGSLTSLGKLSLRKSATLSSSELDTIISWIGIYLTIFISSMVL